MTRAYWSQVKASGLAVPGDRPLADLTTELTTMLGSPDPQMRDGLAYPTLATWVDRGVYDELLVGLGDGMAAGLTVGLGERGTDSVFRRTFSVLVLAECIDRTNQEDLVPSAKLMEWGDRVATWYLREKDVRGFVPDKGWAHAIAQPGDEVVVHPAVDPGGQRGVREVVAHGRVGGAQHGGQLGGQVGERTVVGDREAAGLHLAPVGPSHAGHPATGSQG